MRKIVFWAHFGAGLAAGLFILVMAATGVMLTYEPQITEWAIAAAVEPADGASPLDADAMVAAAISAGGTPGARLVFADDPDMAVLLQSGRTALALDPYTGAPLPEAGAGAKAFFAAVEGLHRWLSLAGPGETGAAVMGAANLVFLALILSGLYLWLPPLWRWTVLRMRLVLRRGLPSAQARHYNWHHVFGIWALVPLFFIALSGVVISYDWASNLVYAVHGEAAPARRGPPAGGPMLMSEPGEQIDPTQALTHAELLEIASVAVPDWRTASLILGRASDPLEVVVMDAGNGHQPTLQRTLMLDRRTGEIAAKTSPATQSPGQRLRVWFRFVHTGEVYGIAGQTVAGLASAAAVMLAYSGLSLGLRRAARMLRARRGRSAA